MLSELWYNGSLMKGSFMNKEERIAELRLKIHTLDAKIEVFSNQQMAYKILK